MPIENSVTVPQQAKELETVTVTTGAGLVHRQVVVIGDQDDPDERLTILDGAVSVRPVGVTPVSIEILPTGIATTALQTAGNDLLNSIDQKLDGLEVNTGLLQGLTDSQLRATPVPVSLAGAATAALQTAGNASLASLDSKNPALVSGRVPTDGSGVTQPVSVASLPLPTGAATAAKQPAIGTAGTASADVLSVQGVAGGTAIPVSFTRLTSASDSVTTVPSGTQTVGGTVTANVGTTGGLGLDSTLNTLLKPASTLAAVTTLGSITGAITLPTGAATAAAQTTGNASLASIDAKNPALVGGRIPVDGSGVTQPVSGTITANIGTTGGLGLDSTLNTLLKPASVLAGLTTLGSITGPVALPTGAATAAAQTSMLTSLQSMDTKLPTVGQKTASSSQPVTMATDQPPIVIKEYGYAVAQGLIAGSASRSIRGYNQATSTTNEPIWAQSGTTYPAVIAAQQLTISSASLLDVATTGTGARTVLVTYVRFSDFVEVSAVFNLNGLTAVTITTDGYAINDVRVLTAGTTGSNQGVLYVGYGALTLGIPATILSTIPAGKNNAQQAIYTVPAAKSLMLTSYRVTPSVLTIVQLRTRSTPTAIQVVEFDIPLSTSIPFDSPIPATPFTAGMQLQFWAATTAGSGYIGLIVSGELRSV
jgi:hypothetical protein